MANENTSGVDEKRGKCRIRYVDSSGKRIQKVLPIPYNSAGIKKALRVRQQLIKELAFEDPVSGEKTRRTFQHVAQLQCDALKSGSANHRRNVVQALNRYWMPYVGDRYIDSLHQGDLLEVMLLAMDQGLSNKYLREILSAASGVFSLAVDMDLASSNPTVGLRKRFKSQKQQPDPFTDGEMEALLDELVPRFRLFYLIRWYCGLRPGELIALRWSDIRDGYMIVSKTRRHGVDGPTKTHQERSVLIHPRVQKALSKVVRHLHCDHVIVNKHGEPYRKTEQMAIAFNEAQERLGLRFRDSYNVRHSCASRLLKAGVKPAFAAKQLGHSLEMFFRIYAKWIDVEETKKQEDIMRAI